MTAFGFSRPHATDAELAERIRDALALPRFGQRIDIGNAVAWLCSEAASFVTGTTISCDGGMRLGNLYAPEQGPTTVKKRTHAPQEQGSERFG